jgi:outer membrane protein TolC
MDLGVGRDRPATWSAIAALLLELALTTTGRGGDRIVSPVGIRSVPSTSSGIQNERRRGTSPADSKVRRVSATEPTSPSSSDADDLPDDRGTSIDLSSALRLAGVENLDLVQARQRVEAAVAVQQLAAAQILPNLNLGMNYDSHTGNLQQASGNILNVQRSALYVGAGANAVAAGTVSIPGLQWNLNVSESIYSYFVTRQRSEQARFASLAEQNAVLLKVASAYTELLQANARLSLAILTRNDAREVARITATYAETGQGRPADASRAATELKRREEDVAETRGGVGRASRRLSELLNLDATIPLRPLEAQIVPQSIVPDRIPLAELVAMAMLDRPELAARRAAIRAAILELDSAKMLPFSPQLMLGFSNGVFGGGSNLVASSTPPVVGLPPNQPRFGDFKDRADIDAIMYWSARNMGLGNKALIDVARARARGADFEEQVTLDRVRYEVAEAFVRTHIRFKEIETRARGVRSGADALVEDLNRVRAGEALPIEVLDSLRRLASERGDYLDAIAGYNKAQFELYVALGNPPADVLARPVPQDLQQTPED